MSQEWKTNARPSGEYDGAASSVAGIRGEDPLALRGEIDRDDVPLIHHARLGSEISGQRELAAIRRDVEVGGRRIPWRQREAGPGERIAAAAGPDVANEHVGLATVGEPMVPETKFRALGDVRLDLGVLALLLPLRLRRPGPEIGPHPADERDPLAIGKPLDRGTAGGQRGQPARLATVGRDQIDLRLVVILAFRGERDPVADGRPFRIAVLVAAGEPARLRGRLAFAVGRKQPQLRSAVVLRHVEARHRRAGQRAIRRQRRRRHAPHRPQGLDGERGLAVPAASAAAAPGTGERRHRRILVGRMERCDSTVRARFSVHLHPTYFRED